MHDDSDMFGFQHSSGAEARMQSQSITGRSFFKAEAANDVLVVKVI